MKNQPKFFTTAPSILITGEPKRNGQSIRIDAKNAFNATGECMTSHTKQVWTALGLLMALLAARSTNAQDTTNVADQVIIFPIPTGTVFERHVVGGEGATVGGERLIYSNTLGTYGAALGAGKLVADDITTTVPGGCSLVRFEFPVIGKVNPAGIGGTYTVDFALYTACPQSVPLASRPGLIIPGTQGQLTFIDQCQNNTDDDSDAAVNDGCPAVGPAESGAQCENAINDDGDTKVNDGCPAVGDPETDVDGVPRLITFVAPPNVMLETNMWFGVKFSRNNAGPVVGAPPLTGFSCDQWDFPGFPCEADAGGFPYQPHASFNLEVYGDPKCAESHAGYKNDLPHPTGFQYNPGEGVFLADDIQLGVSGCDMIAYEVALKGQGFYNFKMQTNCESGIIAGTERSIELPGTLEVKIVRFTFDPPIPLPQDLSFQASVDNSYETSSVIIAGQDACIGHSGNRVYIVGTNGCDYVPPDILGLGIHGAFSFAITCAGAAPVGACCDMIFTDKNGDSVCRVAPQMNCPWPPRFTPLQPAWVEGANCDSNPFPYPCGASACCRPDDVCENLTQNECNAIEPVDGPREWQLGQYCELNEQHCPFVACLPREGDCSFAHEGTGCNDPQCCDNVCRTDAYCCTVEWDRNCADLANEICSVSEHDQCSGGPSGGALVVAADSVTDFSNIRAYEETTDPRFCCSADAPAAVGYGTVWFKFIATDTSARISTCGSDPAGNSLIDVLKPANPATDVTACATLSVIGCSDDVEGCGNDRHGRICVKNLTPGHPYYVMVGSKTPYDQGLYQLEVRSPCFEQPIWNANDCNGNGLADGCELGRRVAADCNGNDRLDECDIADGISFDCDANLFLDECTGLIDELVPALPLGRGGFGSSVDRNDLWLVIGSGTDITLPSQSDRLPLHIFKQNAIGWDLEQTFDLPVSPSFVAMNSEWIVASGDHDNVAHLFRWDGAAWVPAGELLGPNVDDCARYGAPAAIDGDVIALGKGFCQSGPGIQPELVYVFRNVGLQWTEEARLSAPDGVEAISFGAAIAIDGERILVGAPALRGPGPNAAYVFRRGAKDWEYEATLLPSDGAPNIAFGRAVALDSDVAVVGATLADGVGAAFVFRFTGTSWMQEARLQSTSSSIRFGWSVGIASHVLVVGDNYAGLVHVFRRFEGQWVLDPEANSLQGGYSGYFGYAVHTDGSLVMVGAPGSQSVYAFQIEPNDCNNNTVADGCDIRDGTSRDCNLNDVPDDCELWGGHDCNHNSVPDVCDLRDGVSFDCDNDEVSDDCLGLTPFDADADGDTDLFDVAVFMRCYRGVGYSMPESNCTIFDVQHNCFTDLSDFQALHSVFSGPSPP